MPRHSGKLTPTGRLEGEPALQNIPIPPTEVGTGIRGILRSYNEPHPPECRCIMCRIVGQVLKPHANH